MFNVKLCLKRIKFRIVQQFSAWDKLLILICIMLYMLINWLTLRWIPKINVIRDASCVEQNGTPTKSGLSVFSGLFRCIFSFSLSLQGINLYIWRWEAAWIWICCELFQYIYSLWKKNTNLILFPLFSFPFILDVQ